MIRDFGLPVCAERKASGPPSTRVPTGLAAPCSRPSAGQASASAPWARKLLLVKSNLHLHCCELRLDHIWGAPDLRLPAKVKKQGRTVPHFRDFKIHVAGAPRARGGGTMRLAMTETRLAVATARKSRQDEGQGLERVIAHHLV